MATAKINYMSGLRTSCTHQQSGTTIITDAPTDNMGKGEAFSPTDLLATALVSCMLTTMGIVAEREKISFPTASAEMTKVMASNPRRVAEVVVNVQMPEEEEYSPEQRRILEDAGYNCPVARSLSADVKQTITFSY